jgi:hypothetical protein
MSDVDTFSAGVFVGIFSICSLEIIEKLIKKNLFSTIGVLFSICRGSVSE